MFNQRQTRFILYLALTMVGLWIVAISLLFVYVYQDLSIRPAIPISTAPMASQLVAIQATATPLYPATWTPTATPTPTATSTPVSTYPAWVTWTPTATWTATPTLPGAQATRARRVRLYGRHFRSAATLYDLDWRLMMEQGYRESGLNPQALGKDNDMGIMQIIPSTWRRLAPTLDVTDPYDPESNILVAAAYLAEVREECCQMGDTHERCMILAYNWGPVNVRRFFASNQPWSYLPWPQQRYVADILGAAGY